jgi:hypothetical protein
MPGVRPAVYSCGTGPGDSNGTEEKQQVRELHQSMIFDKLTGTGEAYFESAFHDTNLIVGRRVAGLERAFFRVTGRRPR